VKRKASYQEAFLFLVLPIPILRDPNSSLSVRAPQVASGQRMAFPLPDRPSIAVHPFEDLSADKSQNFIVDGTTEGIVVALARFKSKRA